MDAILSKIAEGQIRTYQQINRFSYRQKIIYQKGNDNLKVNLAVKNCSNKAEFFSQSFPNLQIVFHPQHSIQYFIPKAPAVYSRNNIKIAANYGSIMPFSFISIRAKNQQECLLIVIQDQKGSFKEIRFQKNQNKIRFSATFYDISLGPDQIIVFPTLIFKKFKIKIGQAYVQQTIKQFKSLSYQAKIQNSYIQNSNSGCLLNAFNSSFVLRVIQFYQLQWHIQDKRIKSLEELDIVKLVREDEELIGKIGYIHLRDWAAQGDSMKTKFGNYLKKDYVGTLISKQWLKNEIRKLQNVHGCGVGLYLEGYLVSKDLFSQMEQEDMAIMQMKDSKNQPYINWGSANFVFCNSYQKWRKLLGQTIKKLFNYFQVDGVYIDEFGFGSRTSSYKTCINKLHEHRQFDLQTGQLETLKHIHNCNKHKSVNIYIEQTPNEQAFQFINGSLSTSARKAAKNLQEFPILVARFIYPNLKIYEIITEYTMNQKDRNSKGNIIQQDLRGIILGIMVAFWNGNGIYLPKNLGKYNQKILQIIKICNQQYQFYKDYFSGYCPEVLSICDIQKGTNQIIGNKFVNRFGNNLYTLLNWSNNSQKLIFKGSKDIQMKSLSVGVYVEDKQHFKQIYSIC